MARRRREQGTGTQRWIEERWSEPQARRVLEHWRRSGLNLGAWCRREGVGYERVRRWREHLDPSAVPRKQRPTVLPVQLVEPTVVREADAFEVELGSGRRLRVPSQFDEAALVRLLRLLEERP